MKKIERRRCAHVSPFLPFLPLSPFLPFFTFVTFVTFFTFVTFVTFIHANKITVASLLFGFVVAFSNSFSKHQRGKG
jgi:hypothetical protein